MDSLSPITIAGLILFVILIFNLMIFVHELGHFLAARWRGMYVDRFQIWFGRPIWKKSIKGVQYGLGWIPAGGFVSLPQMAPMETIEGDLAEEVKDLKPPTPLDKIIVAFAGPLFSLLLALLFACVVWKTGKPEYQIEPIVGYVAADKPAAKSGILPGDRILQVNGEPVEWWAGDMRGVVEKIMLTEGDTVRFKVRRGDQELDLESGFYIEETSWHERKQLPKVGIGNWMPTRISSVYKNSPVERVGLGKGDEILTVNGTKIFHPASIRDAAASGKPLVIKVLKSSGETMRLEITPVLPQEGSDRPILGVKEWDFSEAASEVVLYPTPWQQVGQSLNWMRITIQKLTAKDSKVGMDQLAGPVGIGKTIFSLLGQPNGILMVLWFSVLLNVNLAVMNMLPVPVLDGGHIVMSTLEAIFRRPVSPRILEIVQTIFALALMGFMVFVTVKDVGSMFGGSEKSESIKFAPTADEEL